MADRSPSPGRRGRPKGSATFPWRSFFQQSATPVFVVGSQRRLRFANEAWERIASTTLASSLGMVCTTRGNASRLAAAMTPTAEALAGRIDRVRRPDPTVARTGPPWWDITFVPLAGTDGLLGTVGFVDVVGHGEPPIARKVASFIADLRDRHALHFPLDLLHGESPASRTLLARARLAASLKHPLWIRGEPGTGRQTCARVIHHAGLTRERAFLALDAEGLQPYLLEGLFFGHGGLGGSDRIGTLFLREPVHLPRDLQQRLLDECSTNRPDSPRLICSSRRGPADDVRAGRLLPAFLGEAGAFEIVLPALRERLEDLPRLTARLLERLSPVPTIEAAAIEVLRAQPWAGNLRELSEVLATAAAEATASVIRPEHLPHEMRVRAGLPMSPPRESSLHRDTILHEVERRLIQMAMQRSGSNAKRAAQILGITTAELARRIKALG